MLWQPAIYEHKAALIGHTPMEVACSADLFLKALLKEYEVYQSDFLTVGLDVYNIEAEALGAELIVPDPYECPDLDGLFFLDSLPPGLKLPAIPGAGRFQLLLDVAGRARDELPKVASLRVAASGPVTLAAKLCGEMLETIRTTGNVHQKTLNRLVNFIDTFSELNFMDDADMAAELDAARRGLLERPAAEYRDSRYARNQLVNGLNRLRSTAAEMAQQDVSGIVESFGQFGQRRFQLAA